MKPQVTLVSYTHDPIGTIYRVWEASKSNRPYVEIEIEAAQKGKQVFEVFQKVIDSQIPVAENLNFVFLLENVSISFREQMVRHRIGVKVGPRLGADLAPDLESSTWWSQSMRILDMGKFADEGHYRLPEGLDAQKKEEFHVAMRVAQDQYNRLVKAGVPMEEAREVIPLAATHRITWGLNLSALQHIIGKRGCQILQLGLWEPIIRGIVEELANKVHPYFRNLINPPCIKDDKFIGCCFKLDNERRVAGLDNLPPCTLYVGKEHHEKGSRQAVSEKNVEAFNKAGKSYGALWGRNPMTGERNAA
ncbi:FAD-dependent thymidylate synthase [Candidatus Parcubacteria bacterium]|nr:FAD-dependent thymidylate synthase [Candidatus Parcubacteria bacterium]